MCGGNSPVPEWLKSFEFSQWKVTNQEKTMDFYGSPKNTCIYIFVAFLLYLFFLLKLLSIQIRFQKWIKMRKIFGFAEKFQPWVSSMHGAGASLIPTNFIAIFKVRKFCIILWWYWVGRNLFQNKIFCKTFEWIKKAIRCPFVLISFYETWQSKIAGRIVGAFCNFKRQKSRCVRSFSKPPSRKNSPTLLQAFLPSFHTAFSYFLLHCALWVHPKWCMGIHAHARDFAPPWDIFHTTNLPLNQTLW